jgi:hydrogenase maturation protease
MSAAGPLPRHSRRSPQGEGTRLCASRSAPVLVFGWGNLSRGDDALGPLCIERLREMAGHDGQVEFLDDYQLQVEHALDLVGRARVLFVDASRTARAPFEVQPVTARQDASFTTHAMSPQALLQVYRDVHGQEPPDCTLLGIRAASFALGEPPSALALSHLEAAVDWARAWIGAPVQADPQDLSHA